MYARHSNALAPIIRVDQGIQAIERVYSECVDMLPVGGIYYRYSSRAEKNQTSYTTMRRYNEKRDQKKIQRLVITNEDLVKISTPKRGRETLAFPSHFPFKQNFQKLIYADRIAIIDLESLTVCVIQSKLLASFEAAIFTCLFHYIRAENEGRI